LVYLTPSQRHESREDIAVQHVTFVLKGTALLTCVAYAKCIGKEWLHVLCKKMKHYDVI
jgi:hypothetical protein